MKGLCTYMQSLPRVCVRASVSSMLIVVCIPDCWLQETIIGILIYYSGYWKYLGRRTMMLCLSEYDVMCSMYADVLW